MLCDRERYCVVCDMGRDVVCSVIWGDVCFVISGKVLHPQTHTCIFSAKIKSRHPVMS